MESLNAYRELTESGVVSPENMLRYFYRQLIALRHRHEIIVYGDYQLLWPEDRQIFAYTRRWKGQILLVVCNLSGQTVKIELPHDFSGSVPLIANLPDTKPESRMILRSWEAFAVLEEGTHHI